MSNTLLERESQIYTCACVNLFKEIREGVMTLHLNRRYGFADVISLLLWKETERVTLRYQGNEATSILEMLSISTT